MSRAYDQMVRDDIPEYVCNESWFEYGGHTFKALENDDYYIRDDGEVLSTKNRKLRYLETWPNQYGHRYTKLTEKDGKRKNISVHREVAKNFIPNPNGYPVVRHKNDDPSDNRYWNLEWGTQADNMNDCRERGRDFHKSVYCFELEKTFRKCADAAEYFRVPRPTITQACKGRIHSINGYHLCYLDEKDEKAKDKKWLNKVGNYKKVIAINNKTGERIMFGSRKEASIELGVSDSGISNVLAGRISHTMGWSFEEGE